MYDRYKIKDEQNQKQKSKRQIHVKIINVMLHKEITEAS